MLTVIYIKVLIGVKHNVLKCIGIAVYVDLIDATLVMFKVRNLLDEYLELR